MLQMILLALMLQGPRNLQVKDAAVAKVYVVPKGTVIPVELTREVSTKNIKAGDNVYARTIFPITVENHIVIPVGSNVRGVIREAERAGRVKGKASLTLSFQTLVLPDGVTLGIYGSLGGSDEGTREGEATIVGEASKGKDAGDVAKAGALGGVLGGVFRGGKGAVIGGAGSAGVALAGVLLSRGEDLTLPKGTTIEVVLDSPIEY